MDYTTLLYVVMLVAVFYFIVIRPQQQRTKQQKVLQDSLEAGDEVVSIGGIYGTVVDVGDRIRVRVADGTEIEFARQAISQKVAAKEDDDSDETVLAD
jgi:preprotein translocase subunit YajC